MDLPAVIGVILGVVAIILGLIFKGTSLLVLLNPAALVIIFLGTAATVLVGFPSNELKRIPSLLKIIFTKEDSQNMHELIDLFVEFSTLARQEGLLALESKIDELDEPYLQQGMKMVVDGLEPDFIRDTMMEELDAIEERHEAGAAIFTQAGTYAPTLGVLGAVLGLIAALGNLNDIDVLGVAIAAAFVATLFGIFTGYMLWHPFANKLRRKSKQEIMLKSLIVEGVLSIQSGVSPRALKDKLIVYIPYAERENVESSMDERETVDG